MAKAPQNYKTIEKFIKMAKGPQNQKTTRKFTKMESYLEILARSKEPYLI
jgi:hypothetical protein